MDLGPTKTAEQHLDEDPDAQYDTRTAPLAVVEPGHGKHAEHVNRHFNDHRGAHAFHVGHSLPRARGQRHVPEGPKKGGFAGWGTIDPEEVQEDEELGEVEAQPEFLEPESPIEEKQALLEAFVPDKQDIQTKTLEDYEKTKPKPLAPERTK